MKQRCLKKTKILQRYNNLFDFLGCLPGEVKIKFAQFKIVPGESVALLGRNACEKLHLVKRIHQINYNPVSVAKEQKESKVPEKKTRDTTKI